MVKPDKDDNATPLNSVGRVLDSRWMMAFAVLAVLVAIAWALLESDPRARPGPAPGRRKGDWACIVDRDGGAAAMARSTQRGRPH